MTTMIERVARALCAQQWPDVTASVGPDNALWTDWTDAARAAIEAMREPDDDMLSESGGAWQVSSADMAKRRRYWTRMIDAALKKSP